MSGSEAERVSILNSSGYFILVPENNVSIVLMLEQEDRVLSSAYDRIQDELKKKSQKVRELEETMYGKQAALDSVIMENEELRARLDAMVCVTSLSHGG